MNEPVQQPRQTRRLSDKILVAFHHACDERDYEVAGELLRVVEMVLNGHHLLPERDRRKNVESLVAAHERLWLLRHPDLT